MAITISLATHWIPSAFSEFVSINAAMQRQAGTHQSEADGLLHVGLQPRLLDQDFPAISADGAHQRHFTLSLNRHLADNHLSRLLAGKVSGRKKALVALDTLCKKRSC